MSSIPDLPHSVEAEVSVLGSLMYDSDSQANIGWLRPQHFSTAAHEKLYAAMLEMIRDGKPIDLVTMVNSLKESGKLASIGGPEYLAYLVEAVPSSAHAQHYGMIVLEQWRRRELILLGDKLRNIAAHGSDDGLAFLSAEAQRIEECQPSEIVSLEDALKAHGDRRFMRKRRSNERSKRSRAK